MLESAHHLLPHVKINTGDRWGSNQTAVNPAQIVRGATLELRAYLYSDSYGPSLDQFSVSGKVAALEKLAAVVLDSFEVTKVHQSAAGRILHNVGRDSDEINLFMDQEHPLPSPLISMRFYKNGKFVVRFKSAADALKVAKALVSPVWVPEVWEE